MSNGEYYIATDKTKTKAEQTKETGTTIFQSNTLMTTNISAVVLLFYIKLLIFILSIFISPNNYNRKLLIC